MFLFSAKKRSADGLPKPWPDLSRREVNRQLLGRSGRMVIFIYRRDADVLHRPWISTKNAVVDTVFAMG
jgi:hypothetical protein